MKRLALLFFTFGTFYFSNAQTDPASNNTQTNTASGNGQVNVGADKSFTANINDYRTYAWATDIDKIPSNKVFVGTNGVLIFNNESARKKIKDAIAYELDARGYKRQSDSADMIVTFQVLEQAGQLQTYNGYQMLNGGFDSVRTPENVQITNVDPGTLIINIIDRRSGSVAWQGYASGILKPDMINDQSKIRDAVKSIFDKFKYKVNG
jgi:hypothetical protein